ncbi:hypothetical protein A4R44_02668 [Amycolatopsis sp. M39]|nr:hypothetical protein A4R44_02668 [Amycolatopsis sp. M39]
MSVSQNGIKGINHGTVGGLCVRKGLKWLMGLKGLVRLVVLMG